MLLKDVRFDWLFVWEKNSKGKYGVCCLFPKGGPVHKAVEAEVKKQVAKGIEKGIFTEAETKSSAFKWCLRDGDKEIETEDRPSHYKGMMFINAYNWDQPGIVGPDTQPMLDQKLFYSGCYGHADIGFYPFKKDGGKGVGSGLNNIMKTKDGERLDGRVSAAEAFDGLQVEDDLQ